MENSEIMDQTERDYGLVSFVGEDRKYDPEPGVELDKETYSDGDVRELVAENLGIVLWEHTGSAPPESVLERPGLTDRNVEAAALELYETTGALEDTGTYNLAGAASIARSLEQMDEVDAPENVEDSEELAREAYERRIEHGHKIASGNLGENADTDFYRFEGDRETAIQRFLEAGRIAEKYELSEEHDTYNDGEVWGRSEYPRRKVLGPLRMAYDLKVQMEDERNDHEHVKLDRIQKFRDQWGLEGGLNKRAPGKRFEESLSRFEREKEIAGSHAENCMDAGNFRRAAEVVNEYNLHDLKNKLVDRHAEQRPEETERHYSLAEEVDLFPILNGGSDLEALSVEHRK